MATTTFKSVGGTSKPETRSTPSAKPAKAAVRKATPKKTAPKKADLSGGAGKTVTIKGEGTMPIYGDGGMRRVPLGELISVSEAERAHLDRAGVHYV